MPGKTASVIGSTGLIGNHLVEFLTKDKTFSTIRTLVRRPIVNGNEKVEMKLVNFEDHESVKLAIDGSDAVFCAVGTTQKKVKGDKQAYRKVDYDIPVNAARFCAETGCPNFVLVSSVGAKSDSKNFYLKLKGDVEDAIQQFAIRNISIFRPSILLGNRSEKRTGEKLGQGLASFFAFMMLGKWEKYRPVEAEHVAKAMIQSAKEEERGRHIYEYDDIRHLAALYQPYQNIIAHQHPK
ncbi:MAG: NAD-dependent epimerase/dehydratase family protein [Chitinophagaceae bacterium]|nr:MAG: NAD-dependent epimerase/dehydratase family protein [Chitinophagaceae bacterium]